MPPFGEYTAIISPFCGRAALPTPRTCASSFAPPGSTKTASTIVSLLGSSPFCGTVTMMIRVPADAVRMRLATSSAIEKSCLPPRNPSSMTISGFSVAICAIAAAGSLWTPATSISFSRASID